MAGVTPRILAVKKDTEQQLEIVQSSLDDIEANNILVDSLVRLGPQKFDGMNTTLERLIRLMRSNNTSPGVSQEWGEPVQTPQQQQRSRDRALVRATFK